MVCRQLLRGITPKISHTHVQAPVSYSVLQDKGLRLICKSSPRGPGKGDGECRGGGGGSEGEDWGGGRALINQLKGNVCCAHYSSSVYILRREGGRVGPGVSAHIDVNERAGLVLVFPKGPGQKRKNWPETGASPHPPGGEGGE